MLFNFIITSYTIPITAYIYHFLLYRTYFLIYEVLHINKVLQNYIHD
jgi:hypothetical protein